MKVLKKAEIDVACLPSSFATLRQYRDALFHRLYLRQPILIWVRRGCKIISIGNHSIQAEEGGVVALSAGSFVDVNNVPDHTGIYEANVFAIGSDLKLEPNPVHLELPRFGSFNPPHEFAASFEAARDALNESTCLPTEIIQHKLLELLVWSRKFGIEIARQSPTHLPARAREIIGIDPGRNWKVTELAAKLFMSEPTLRRKLAENNTTAIEIIADVRLTRALEQLQTTNDSIAQIAFDLPLRISSERI